MDQAERLKTDPDYVCLPRYGCSLKRVLERYPDGLPTDTMAAKALDMSEDAFQTLVAGAMAKLKAHFDPA